MQHYLALAIFGALTVLPVEAEARAADGSKAQSHSPDNATEASRPRSEARPVRRAGPRSDGDAAQGQARPVRSFAPESGTSFLDLFRIVSI